VLSQKFYVSSKFGNVLLLRNTLYGEGGGHKTQFPRYVIKERSLYANINQKFSIHFQLIIIFESDSNSRLFEHINVLSTVIVLR
jgi:hypothetical protein